MIIIEDFEKVSIEKGRVVFSFNFSFISHQKIHLIIL